MTTAPCDDGKQNYNTPRAGTFHLPTARWHNNSGASLGWHNDPHGSDLCFLKGIWKADTLLVMSKPVTFSIQGAMIDWCCNRFMLKYPRHPYNSWHVDRPVVVYSPVLTQSHISKPCPVPWKRMLSPQAETMLECCER